MTGSIKLSLMLTVAAVSMILQVGWAQAANLSKVRTGKHEKFTRVVFEFKNNVLFEDPEIKGKGKFSLVFHDSSTTLPHLTLFKTGPIQLVRSIEFSQQKTNLTANVQLSFPYFILKAFPLSSPNRVVVDVYQVFSPHEKPEQKESLSEKPLIETPIATEEKEVENASQNDLGKANDSNVTALPNQGKAELNETTPSENNSSDKSSNEITEKMPESPNLANKNSMTQIYLLTMLNVLTGVIIVLMVLTLLKKKRTISLDHPDNIMEFLKKSDESIDTIDAQLKNAFKEYDQS